MYSEIILRCSVLRKRRGTSDASLRFMNWRRGFFRLWLLLSVAWIIGVGAFTYLMAGDGYRPMSSAKTVNYYPSSNSVDGGYGWGNDCSSWEPRGHEIDVAKFPFEHVTVQTVVVCESEGTGESWVDGQIRAGTMRTALGTIEQAILQHDQRERAELWELLAYAVGAGVLVPLVILTIGGAIAWALKGFRASS